jgi:aminoglycoside 6'-N-acetyltransferase
MTLVRPMQPEDAPRLREIRATPEVHAWWGVLEDDFPLGDEPEVTRLTIVVEDRVAGMVQYGEEEEPDFRHAWIDIFVDPALRGRGIGTAAIEEVVEHLIGRRGHHRITIDPAVDNGAAVRSYEKAGFRPVGVMQAAWRDPSGRWRDALLMELVRTPDTPARSPVPASPPPTRDA